MPRTPTWMFALATLAISCLAARPAASTPIVYAAVLEPEALGATGSGNARVTIDPEAFAMRVEASFSGLSGQTTAAHVHCCTATPGEGGAQVATVVPTFPDFPLGVTAGTYDESFDLSSFELSDNWNPAFSIANGFTRESVMAAFIAGVEAGRAYFNVHSSTFPGGEIRGFLVLVPEPATGAFVLLGLVALARSRRAHPPR